MLEDRQQQEGSAMELAAVLRSCSPGRQPPLWGLLPSLTCPALFVAGSLDVKFVRLGRDMAQAVSSRQHFGASDSEVCAFLGQQRCLSWLEGESICEAVLALESCARRQALLAP